MTVSENQDDLVAALTDRLTEALTRARDAEERLISAGQELVEQELLRSGAEFDAEWHGKEKEEAERECARLEAELAEIRQALGLPKDPLTNLLAIGPVHRIEGLLQDLSEQRAELAVLRRNVTELTTRAIFLTDDLRAAEEERDRNGLQALEASRRQRAQRTWFSGTCAFLLFVIALLLTRG